LSALADEALARGARRLIGRYEATRKNVQVADFYPNNGFEAIADHAGTFSLELGRHRPPKPAHIDLVR
jgi:predicted enzyme involved in methoxymalonyl-ACP biosynthesis